jgi:hemoglobin
MSTFYQKVAKDNMLAPYFFEELGDDLNDTEWVEHVELLADFWMAHLLEKDTYFGNFIGAHAKMRHIKKEAYGRWLKLFEESADEIYTPDTAELFKKKALEFVKQFLSTNLKI